MSLNFSTGRELLALCAREGVSIAELTLRREAASSGRPASEALARMAQHYATMRDAIRAGLRQAERSPSGLSGGDARRLAEYAAGAPALDARLVRTLAYGFAVLEHNAVFGRIVATPTAGSAGVVPACLLTLQEDRGLSDEACARLLFAAAGIGHIVGAQACFSGAQGGCQAEVGSAAAMAAAAVAEGLGGTPAQALEAASFALMNTLGLVCDPVGGYVEVPCVARNGMYAAQAYLAAIVALAGVRGVIPFDDVVLALRDIGRRMPRELKETSEGGLAATPTGQRYRPAPAHSSAPSQPGASKP